MGKGLEGFGHETGEADVNEHLAIPGVTPLIGAINSIYFHSICVECEQAFGMEFLYKHFKAWRVTRTQPCRMCALREEHPPRQYPEIDGIDVPVYTESVTITPFICITGEGVT